MEINAVLLDDIDDPEYLVIYLCSTCIVYLSTAGSIERCCLKYDELAVLIKVAYIQDFAVSFFFCISKEYGWIKVTVF